MASVELMDVSKSYGDVEVLRNINLSVEQGELVVFVGPSGCGKSTLLRMIAGLEKITGGELQIDGQRMNETPPAQRGIAMVFQTYALYPHMTVRENMAFGMKIAKKPQAEIDAAIANAARILQLDQYLDRLPKALSGGQRQRVAIGRSIVRDPKVFLFDEPLSNLDAALRVATRIEIAQLKESMPESTMIYVTHDQVEAMTLATRIVVLHGGDIEQVGSPLELYERPRNIFTARFIGSPSMNILGGKITTGGAHTSVELEGGGQIGVPIATPEGTTGTIHLGVRPEDLVVTDADSFVYEGQVNIVEALGETTVLYFDAQGSDEALVAKIPGIQAFEKGQTVRLSAVPEKLHLFDENGISYLYK